MTAGKESRTAYSVAIAQSLAQSDIDALLASSSLWDAPDRVSVKSVTGQTPEDFSHNKRFSVCFLPSGVGREWLGGLTRLDCDTFVECSSEIDFADLAPLIPTNGGRSHALSVCMSTRSAYHLPVARKFVTALRHRGLIAEKIAATVEMAVQEAFANSLIHGNLELDTSGHLSMDSFTELGEETKRRLASSKHGARVILLTARRKKNGHIVITVNDQGNGFTPIRFLFNRGGRAQNNIWPRIAADQKPVPFRQLFAQRAQHRAAIRSGQGRPSDDIGYLCIRTGR